MDEIVKEAAEAKRERLRQVAKIRRGITKRWPQLPDDEGHERAARALEALAARLRTGSYGSNEAAVSEAIGDGRPFYLKLAFVDGQGLYVAQAAQGVGEGVLGPLDDVDVQLHASAMLIIGDDIDRRRAARDVVEP